MALVKNNHPSIKRIMIYKDEHGVYLFGYDKIEDSSGLWDQWYQTVEEVYQVCKEDYGIQKEDWKEIPDPLKDCQHDWIEPVRIKGKDKGKPEWGKLEKLINNEWIEIK